MRVGDSVRKAIDDAMAGEAEAAMLHACNAVDGTAAKTWPNIKSSRERFVRLLRGSVAVLGPMALPGIDIVRSRFPVDLAKRSVTHDLPDFAEVVYGVHRCCHGHGDELPRGFELMPNAAAGTTGYTNIRLDFRSGTVRLSDRVIYGLLGVAVMAPVNIDQRAPDGYYLTMGETVMHINDWWGRASDFPAVAALYPSISVVLNLAGWLPPRGNR